MRPKSYGSSTIGVKKSTVWTSANWSLILYTPASSLVAIPTSTFGSVVGGKRRRTCARSAAPTLLAQPALDEYSVSRIGLELIVVVLHLGLGTSAGEARATEGRCAKKSSLYSRTRYGRRRGPRRDGKTADGSSQRALRENPKAHRVAHAADFWNPRRCARAKQFGHRRFGNSRRQHV